MSWHLNKLNHLNYTFQDFECKLVLFSLVSSEVLIVNLWEHQVGLYQGTNMGLLRSISAYLGRDHKKGELSFYHDLSANVSSCNANQCTLLLFIIYNHIGITPLVNLQATLGLHINEKAILTWLVWQ